MVDKTDVVEKYSKNLWGSLAENALVLANYAAVAYIFFNMNIWAGIVYISLVLVYITGYILNARH